MDKQKLYIFSLELKKILVEQRTSEVEQKIKQANLSQIELNFLFQCLHSNGYDAKTDSFILYESDNSAFLKLVNLVQSNVSNKKK